MMTTSCSAIYETLHKMREPLAAWLTRQLSSIDKEYWRKMVLPKLSFQQTRMVESASITDLYHLDIAGLLRVFDKNWYDLEFHAHLPRQLRSYLKELQIIRNRYAHQNEDIPKDEQLRDMDTIYRFLKGIGAPTTLQSDIKAMAGENQTEIGSPDSQPVVHETYPIRNNEIGEFVSGKLVQCKSSPNKRGVILSIDGNDITVFMDGEEMLFFKEQLELVSPKTEPFVPLSMVRNNLTSFLIRHPSIPSLYSLNAARIDVIPYQFKPVLKLIRSDLPRLLIADSVGVGKTIEAGLVLRELQIRNDIQSVLIICPKPLITERKWELEMRRFDEDFEVLDSRRLDYCIKEFDREGEWPKKYEKVILPFSVCDEKMLKKLGHLDRIPQFDLLIIDEAHHIRNPLAIRHKVAKVFCDAASAIVFLTATPLQLGNLDLFVLLNLLRPDLVPDGATFNIMHSPNKFVTNAIRFVRAGNYSSARQELIQAGRTEGGDFLIHNPDYEDVLTTLGNNNVFNLEDQANLLNKIARLHTFDSLINRTVRKEIDSEFAVRHPQTVSSQMSIEERAVYDRLLSLRKRILNVYHEGSVNVNFLMSMLERQASSCIHGLAPYIGALVTKSLQETDIDVDEEELFGFAENDVILRRFHDEIQTLCDSANSLPDYDPKFEKFLEIIRQKQQLENKKVIVFSTFRHTLSYLEERLNQEGLRVGVIHGGVPDDDRIAIRAKFEQIEPGEDAIDILLFSEVGCEGLDYQFCDTMINYDLPWNPMKIEQRIGRIDRFGQKSDAVAIYNMIVEDTIDARIYYRCLKRIGVFESSIGSCDTILGDIYSEIKEVADATSLSPEQQEEKLDQIALNNQNQLKCQAELEEHQAELFSIPAKYSATKEMENLENYWLSPDSLFRLTTDYLRQKTGVETPISGMEMRRQLRLSQEARAVLMEDFRKLPLKKGCGFREWELYLKGDSPYCAITFDTSLACREKNVQFIMPLHPLVQQAATFFKTDMPIRTSLQVIDEDVPMGDYPFLLYNWDYKGLTNQIQLKAFSSIPQVESKILTYLETGAPILQTAHTKSGEDQLRRRVHDLWGIEKENHKKTVQRWLDYKIRSLTISTEAQRKTALDRKVSNIREGELRRIDERYQLSVAKLDQDAKTADIFIRLILSGVVRVIHEEV